MLALLALVAGAAGDAGPSPDDAPLRALAVAPVTTSVAAQTAFLGAWRHSLESSWSVEESLHRTTTAGAAITFAIHRAQRPPDRVQIGLGSVDARLGGRTLACATDAAGRLDCRSAAGGGANATSVDEQLRILTTYIRGPGALYAVTRNRDCFDLVLRIAGYPVPPYGQRAQFCFDPATGAPTGSIIERVEGVDRTTVVERHAPARDTDLRLPPGATIDEGRQGPS